MSKIQVVTVSPLVDPLYQWIPLLGLEFLQFRWFTHSVAECHILVESHHDIKLLWPQVATEHLQIRKFTYQMVSVSRNSRMASVTILLSLWVGLSMAVLHRAVWKWWYAGFKCPPCNLTHSMGYSQNRWPWVCFSSQNISLHQICCDWAEQHLETGGTTNQWCQHGWNKPSAFWEMRQVWKALGRVQWHVRYFSINIMKSFSDSTGGYHTVLHKNSQWGHTQGASGVSWWCPAASPTL